MKLRQLFESTFLTDTFKIKQWLVKMNVKKFSIRPDGTVNVNGDVDMSHQNLTEIPIRFGKVTRDFYCSGNQITSLVGISKIFTEVGVFHCDWKEIKRGGIGLIMVAKQIDRTFLTPPFKIIAKYLGKGKPGVIKCHQELIDNDLDEYAEL